MPDSSNCPSFLYDSDGGLGLPPKASGCGAPRPSSPLVLPEQHDEERRPAQAQRERPHGRLPAVQEPPGADGLPAAGPGCRPAKASPQNAPGALRHRIPVRKPQGHRRGEGIRQPDNWQLRPLSSGLKVDLGWATVIFILFYFL